MSEDTVDKVLKDWLDWLELELPAPKVNFWEIKQDHQGKYIAAIKKDKPSDTKP